MQIPRHFTKSGDSPFAGVPFSTVTIEICHADPESRLCLPAFEVPVGWGYEACEFLARHYVRRTGVPAVRLPVPEEGVPMWLWRSVPHHDGLKRLPESERFGSESSVRQVIERLAGAWTYWGWTHDYFDTEADARAFHDECCYLIATQRLSPAAPQWLNTGLHWAYGIEGEAQGHFHIARETAKVVKSENAYHHPQHHHCFIQSVRDELVSDGGIMDLWEREARLFKYGSGAGCNMSSIRGASERLSTGTPSVGLMRFLSIGDKTAGAIKASSGAAQVDKLVVVDGDHPEIESFIRWKMQEEHKAAALVSGARQMRRCLSQILEAIAQVEGDGRFDVEHNSLLRQAIAEARRAMIPPSAVQRVIDYARQGLTEVSLPVYGKQDTVELLQQVGGHQAQLAVRLTDDFMHKAGQSASWNLTSRVGAEPVGQMPADQLLDQIAQAAWAVGDPSVQFDDTIAQWHGCKMSGPVRGASPRGEFLFLDDTACDIATLNLLHFVDADGEFDTAAFERVARLMVVMLDLSITMGQYPSKVIAENTYRFRPIGLSYCNMAAALMKMGYAYDSMEGRAMAAAITAILTGAGYVASADLARELGAFEGFSENREPMMRLMWQHHEAALGRSQQISRSQVNVFALDHASLPQGTLSDVVQRVWDLAMIRGDEYGFSNAQISVVAASANSMKLLGASSAAAMPMASLVQIDLQESGRKHKQVRPQVVSALKLLGYSVTQIDDILRYLCGAASLKGSPAIDHQALQSKGFTLTQIFHVEEALGYVRHIRHAFDPFVIGEGFCRDVLRLNDLQMHDAAFDLLEHLDFSEEEIDAANRFACGAGSMEDAPHLREEDVAVFALDASLVPDDCRVTAYAQLQMMAAIQPFVSGGISHPLVLPSDVPIAACRTLIEQAWGMGLKNLSLTREGNGLSLQEPLQDAYRERSKKLAVHRPRTKASEVVAPTPAPVVNTGSQMQRDPLPARRSGFIQKASVGGEAVYLHMGEYPDGRLGEIFIDLPEQPESVRALASHFAISISLSLQHGVPLAALHKAFRSCNFGPSGVVEGSEYQTSARSVLEYVYTELMALYGAAQTTISATTTSSPDEMVPELSPEDSAQILDLVRHL